MLDQLLENDGEFTHWYLFPKGFEEPLHFFEFQKNTEN